jgi:hypothetical protein
MIGAGGTENLVVTDDDDIVSATYSATGTYDLVLRHSYPALKSDLGVTVNGTTAGLKGRFTAIDVVAKTATIIFEVGATATVLAATDIAYINLLCRNSGANG